MSQKNILLVVTFATFFAASTNAAELPASMSPQTASKISDLAERRAALDKEQKEVQNQVDALNGGAMPLSLRAKRGALARKLKQLNQEATDLKANLSANK
jgi:peptidoglycan hydrolase CwlO-like protein